jgi:hypothetical protein
VAISQGRNDNRIDPLRLVRRRSKKDETPAGFSPSYRLDRVIRRKLADFPIDHLASRNAPFIRLQNLIGRNDEQTGLTTRRTADGAAFPWRSEMKIGTANLCASQPLLA